MHQRLLVTFNKENAENSEEARSHAFTELEWDSSFVDGSNSPNRFGSAICDWFVIGGRWTGDLVGNKLGLEDMAIYGNEEDAQIVTKEIYEKFLKEYEGEWHDSDAYFCDLDEDEVSEDFIDKKWIVVIDFHY